jgi:hypothetical protein
VNGDGLAHILAGGHEWEGAPSVVLLSNGSGSFAQVTPRVLPAVPNEGVVLNFVILEADRDGMNEIYVLRRLRLGRYILSIGHCPASPALAASAKSISGAPHSAHRIRAIPALDRVGRSGLCGRTVSPDD